MSTESNSPAVGRRTPPAGSASLKARSKDYRLGYSAGYSAGLRKRWKDKMRANQTTARRLPQHDGDDPIVRAGYEAARADDTRNPHPQGSDEYYKFNKGCWVAWGMATFYPQNV